MQYNHATRIFDTEADDFTYSTTLTNLLPATVYECCVSAVRPKSNATNCTRVVTHDSSSSQGCNSDTVGGVLGTMSVILVLVFLLVGLGIAVAYLAFKLKKRQPRVTTAPPL